MQEKNTEKTQSMIYLCLFLFLTFALPWLMRLRPRNHMNIYIYIHIKRNSLANVFCCFILKYTYIQFKNNRKKYFLYEYKYNKNTIKLMCI